MNNDNAIEYHFSGYRLDARHKKLYDPNGEPVALSARPFDALLLLLERHGQILSREEMMEAVWPKLFVEENNLTQAISTIRKALNDAASESQFVRTVPGRGYSFIAAVEKIQLASPVTARSGAASAPQEGAPTWRRMWLTQAVALGLAVVAIALFAKLLAPDDALTPPEPGSLSPLGVSEVPRPESRIPNSIAVLPLTTLSPEEDPMFSAGLHDEIISQLTKIRSLNVIARSSVMALLEGGSSTLDLVRILRVESILSGTIRLAGTEARISLQLLDVSSGLTMWSGTYDVDQLDLAKMISVQGDIALNVATALKAEIPNDDAVDFATLPTEQLRAHRFNLAARGAQSHQKYAEAWRLAQKSIALDPDFYEALDTFSALNIILIAAPLPGMNSRLHAELALEHANRMIELMPERSEGYALKAAALAAGKDWSGAGAALTVLDRLNAPKASLEFVGLVLLARGDFERAAEIYEATLVTDLINPYARGLLMAAHELAGRRDLARSKFASGQELHDQWWGETVDVLLALGRDEAPADVEQLAIISDELKAALARATDAAAVRAALEAYDARSARNSVETLLYAALAARHGDHARAIDLLRSTTHEVGTWLFWSWLPVFDLTRREPGFRALLRESGLVDYWQTEGWPRMCRPNGADFSCDWSAYPLTISAAL